MTRNLTSYRRGRGMSAPFVITPSFARQRIGSYARVIARAARSAAAGTGATATMMGRSRTTSGGGVTSNYDRRRVYRKKYMPKRKKRSWIRFNRKVNAVSEKTLGLQTVVFNSTSTASNNTNNFQGEYDLALYGMNSSETRYDDVDHIAENVNIAAPSPTVGQMMDLTTKLIFKSAVLDITVRNISHLSADATQTPNCAIELDVYEITGGRQFAATLTATVEVPTTLLQAFSFGENATKTIAGTGNAVSILRRGCTPWDIPQALSQNRLKIVKKTKYFLPAGNTFTYQMRDPKRRVSTQKYLSEYTGINKPGWTKFLLIIFKAVPGFAVNPTVGYTEKIEVGSTRKYSYVYEGNNERRDAWYNR